MVVIIFLCYTEFDVKAFCPGFSDMLGECVISLVLFPCSKDLKWGTSVTALLKLSFIWLAKEVYPRGVMVGNPKGEASIHLGFLLLYICLLSPLSLPYANWAGQEGAVFVLPEVLTPVYGFSFVLFLWAFPFL